MKLYSSNFIVLIFKAIKDFFINSEAFLINKENKRYFLFAKNPSPVSFKKRFLPVVIFILTGFGFSNTQAATITSTAQGGLWNNTATWVGSAIPTSSDDVVIAKNSNSFVR